MSDFSPEIRSAVRIANRHLDTLTEHEQEQVLIALVETGEPDEAAAANDVLYYQRKRDRAQLTLRAIIEGIGKAS